MDNSSINNNLIHHLNNQDQGKSFSSSFFISLIVIAIVAGTGLGRLITRVTVKQEKSTTSTNETTTKKSAGIVDKKTFKDNAEGLLKEGGIDGEGNFHLERAGDESQNVYLTSTTVDLSQFVGKKVKVWGETFSAEKAGWLMDVGLVEVLQ